MTNRIKTYHAQTEPLIDYYKKAGKYYECNCDAGEISENRRRVLSLVDNIPPTLSVRGEVNFE